ncbi:XRE family transcriptional regulator [Peribacillus muralis]|uniref:XRE family transcriptional regulator n=1 Tax=Peribacillus muralis TaxID=264697 RepID=A0A1B3XVB9_9BACI|nr:helix-turn-helix domain-containing protein [Peribacillus muralis]AOH57149.1 XRE family transcriptional regulator [Peribacillus muralis]
MDFFAVGKKIKELRKQIGLSQEELSEGICTQAQISKIEKGDVYPYATTLYLISKRLGVDVNYFFDIGMTPRLDYVQEVSHQLKIARRTMNYQEMKEIVRTEEKNPLFTQNKQNHQLLIWHKGIYEYMMNKNLDKAIQYLEEAIALSDLTDKVYSEREIEYLISMGVIYFEEKLYEKARYIDNLALTHLNHLPFLNDKTIKTRLFYNSARVSTRLEDYNASIAYCKEAIKWCLQEDHLYLLGELHYHLGYNYELQTDYKNAKKCMERARLIFDLQKEKRFVTFIDEKFKAWEINLKIH